MIQHMTCDERFIALAKEFGYDIYGENTAGGHYATADPSSRELHISGLVPRMNGKIQYPGRVGLDLSMADAQAAASISAMRGLALIVDAIGSLDKIKSLIRVTVYVKSTADFVDLSEVANGASDVFSHVLGDAGKHTRTTVRRLSVTQECRDGSGHDRRFATFGRYKSAFSALQR